ncbi:MAG: glycosyltransferase involved in cell wall biosynthesis [Lentisphaeria bacterium]|jgi:glycosyltransferase involved in cell wall biosynthesis
MLGQANIAHVVGEFTHDENDIDLTTLVLLEAKIILSTVIDEELVYWAHEVSLDAVACDKMDVGRNRFNATLPELLTKKKGFWASEIKLYRTDPVALNVSNENIKSSVILTTISRRFDSLLRRMDEFALAYDDAKNMELIIVVADPDAFKVYEEELFEKLSTAAYQVKVVSSKKNNISVNRNIGASLAAGEYCLFWDDDVQLVGPVLQRMIAALDDSPEAGTVQITSYDHNSCLFKPYPTQLKYPYKEDVFLTNYIVGMLIGMRTSIIEVLPFPNFINNFAEDLFQGLEVHGLGFLHLYIVADDVYTIHEDNEYRLTRNSDTEFNTLIFEVVAYYFEIFTREEVLYTGGRFRIKRYVESKELLKSSVFFDVLERALACISGDDQPLCELIGENYSPVLFDGEEAYAEKIFSYLTRVKSDIVRYKKEYIGKKLTSVNPYLGCFRKPQLTFSAISNPEITRESLA